MDQEEKRKREEKREQFNRAYREIMEVIESCSAFSSDHRQDLKKRMIELSKYFSYFLWEGCFVGSPIRPPRPENK